MPCAPRSRWPPQVAGDVAQSVGEFFSQLGETLGGVWDGICSTVQGAIDAIAGFFQGLAGTASSIWDASATWCRSP